MTAMTTDALTLAEAKLSELEARLAHAREAAATSRLKAHDLAFAAEGQDDDAAKRLASKLLGDAHKLDEDCEHRLGPAVDEARKRAEAARKANAREAERANAGEAKALAERLERIGAAIDAGFDKARTAQRDFAEVMDKLRRLGAPTPTRELVEANHKRSLDAALAGLHPEARPVPPLQRRKFAALYAGWGLMALNWSAKLLGSDEKREAA